MTIQELSDLVYCVNNVIINSNLEIMEAEMGYGYMSRDTRNMIEDRTARLKLLLDKLREQGKNNLN